MKNKTKFNLRFTTKNYLSFLFLLLLMWLTVLSDSQAFGATWTGAGITDDWSDPDNWLGGVLPGSATFTDMDSGNVNIVDAAFTDPIFGLQYIGNGTHTTDFNGSSNLQINGPLYVGYGGSANGADVTWTNGGSVQIGDPANLQAFYIGLINTTSGTNTSSLLIDGPSVDAFVSSLMIGYNTHGAGSGQADASLILGSNSSLHVGSMANPGNLTISRNLGWMSGSGGSSVTGLFDATQGDAELYLTDLHVGYNGYDNVNLGTAEGTLRWDQTDPIYATNVYFGRGASTGILEVPSGGTFLLGTANDPVSVLYISFNDSTSGTSNAHLDFWVTNPTFEAYVQNLTIGYKAHGAGPGQADGSLVLGSKSSLHVGSMANPGNVTISRNRSWIGGSETSVSTGLLDAAQGDADFYLNELNVGYSGWAFEGIGLGTTTGTLRWDQPDPIYATDVYFARGPSTGILDVPAGGSFLLGTAGNPLSFLGVSYNDMAYGVSNAQLDFGVTNPTFEAYTQDLRIGSKLWGAGSGQADGSLILGSNSSLHVGSMANHGNVTIGRNRSWMSGSETSVSTGVLDATQGDADFYLNELNVGYAGWASEGIGLGTTTGTLHWNQPDPIYATDVYFARGPSTGILDVPAGGNFLLGTASNPLSFLGISYNDMANGVSNAQLDFGVTNPTFDAYTQNLMIGAKLYGGGSGQADGSLVLGSNSSLNVGSMANPGNVTISRNRSWMGGSETSVSTGLLDATQGNADFHLNELNVGYGGWVDEGIGLGTTTGTLKWDQPDPIYATDVYFARDSSTGILDVPAGGTFLLGTAGNPLSFLGISYNDLAYGVSNAQLDFGVTNPTFEAYTQNLVIGAKLHGAGPGQADGSLILGSNSSLHVGSIANPGNVTIGRNRSWMSGSESSSVTGLLDATEGDADLYLTDLNVGYSGFSNLALGTSEGTFTMGDGSQVTASNVNVAVTGSGGTATGTVNLAGGRLSAETVNMGSDGTFNFTGGRLELGTFNTYGGVGSLDQQGGTLAPGFSAGQATLNGDFNLFKPGTLEIELFGTTSRLDYDQFIVNGAVDLNYDNLGGGMLDVVLGFDTQFGDSFIIMDNDGIDPIQGYFYGLPEGSLFSKTYNNTIYKFEISYMGHTGNDIVLNTVIPAPGAIVLGAIGVGFIGWLRRKQML